MKAKTILLSASVLLAGGLRAESGNKMININKQAAAVCSKSICIDANSEKVWAVLSNINAWPTWQQDIKAAKIIGVVVAGNCFEWKSGGLKIKSRLHRTEAEKFLGWTGKAMGIYAIHNWQISERDGITTVIVEESMDGFFARLFKKSLNKNLQEGMQRWLEQLKLACED
jgi:uncharacterized membrane protein